MAESHCPNNARSFRGGFGGLGTVADVRWSSKTLRVRARTEVPTFCPQCTAEYRAGFTRCSTCAVDLVNQPIGVKTDDRRRSIDSTVKFVLLTYAVTWLCAAIGLSGKFPSFGPSISASTTLILLGSFAPSIVALGMTVEEGRAGSMALLGRLFDWRVAARWYVLAVCYPVAILSGVEIAHRLIAGAWVSFRPPQGFAIVTSTILTLPVIASEEIGWRGYALPRLTRKFGLRRASLILGLIWACWHLPVFFTPGRGAYVQTIPTFVLEVTALSVAFAWLYGNTNGSLLPVTLMHSAIDESFSVLPALKTSAGPFMFTTELVPWLIIGFAWLFSAYFLARMPRASGNLFCFR